MANVHRPVSQAIYKVVRESWNKECETQITKGIVSMVDVVKIPKRSCAYCGKLLHRRPGEKPYRFKHRVTCGIDCGSRYANRKTFSSRLSKKQIAARIAAASLVKQFRYGHATHEQYLQAVAVLGKKDAEYLLADRRKPKRKCQPKITQPDGRKCLWCGRSLMPKPKETASNYRRRKCCDSYCSREMIKAQRLNPIKEDA